VYVETDVLVALAKDDDWLQDAAVQALDEYEDDVQTSILAYAELLVVLYDRDTEGYDVDVTRALTNLLELVPIVPGVHEDAVLAAAAFLEEEDLTPFDALHAGLAVAHDERVLSSERDYDAIDVDRVPLEDGETY